MTTRSHRALPVRRCFGGLLVVLACLIAGNGCVTPTYHATELPLEFAAKPVDRLNTADLSKLVSHSVRSNQIGVGDLLEVAVFAGYSGHGETEPNKVNVTADGTVDVPMIGPVRVDGLTPEEAQFAIREAAIQRDVFRTPHVSVKMEEQRVNRIAVSGEVMEPQVVEIPKGNSSLLNAILAAGGLTEYASEEVTICRPALAANAPDAIRGNPLRLTGGGDSVVLASYEEESVGEKASTFEVNLVSATEQANGVYTLDDGDVVHVKKRPERKIRVGGLVQMPGEFDMPPNEDLYLVDALAMAGGHSLQMADSIVVLRRMPGTLEPVTIKASVRDANRGIGDIRLQANDVVIVEETPVTVAFETLKTFFRFSVGSSLALF